jgi:hypothetical protein
MNSKFWSGAINIGGATLHNPAGSNSIKFYQPTNFHLNAIYKFNHIFGIRPNINYHIFVTDAKPNVNYANFTVDGIVDFNQIGTYGFREQIYEFSVLGHLGYGFSTMWKDRFSTEDPYIKGNDDMMTISFGVTPRMRLSRNMLLNFDVSYVTHILQQRAFDWVGRNDRNFGGGFMRYSFGITYEFIK